jgi:hypothetical protein
MRWFSAARLAHALGEAGFSVSACRPADHPLDVVDTLVSDHRLRRIGRLASLEAAIRSAAPDILLPDDERAWALLRRLHARTTDPETSALIAHSLGHPDDWPLIASRTAVAVEARAAGVRVPATSVITSSSDLAGWSCPLVLKTDGSWGGRGVAVVRDQARLAQAWSTVSRPPGLPRVIKRMLVNRDVDGLVARLRGRRPVVNAQQFVEGTEAIVTVTCLDGKVRDLICMEVVHSSAARGPATVVRIIDHPTMAEAARRLVERFGLSGFCGLDFILDADDQPYLIELNPRVTPTCHLLVEGTRHEGRAVALFPPEVSADLVDVPVRAHALIRLGEEMTAHRLHPLSRMGRRLSQRLNAPRY